MLSIRCNRRIKSWRIRKNPERITKSKPSLNKYKWDGITFPSEKDDWKENNLTIALNVLYHKKRKQYILLMFQKIAQILKKKLFF